MVERKGKSIGQKTANIGASELPGQASAAFKETEKASLVTELDIASQGDSIEQARDNLREAVELFFECTSPEKVKQRLRGDVYATQVEVATG